MNGSKCPFCGGNNLYPMPLANGTSYVLTTIDSSYGPPKYNASAVPVILMGCTDCQGIHIICPSLKEKK